MKYIKRAWHYVLAEPFTWLFYCFFQPARFKRECESTSPLNRMIVMLRLALPMFLCSYLLVLLVRAIGEIMPGSLTFLVGMNSTPLATVTGPSIMDFLLAVALTTVASIAWGVLWGIVGGTAGGIAWGITLSIAVGIGGVDIRGGYTGVSDIVANLGLNTFSIAGIGRSIVLGIVGGIIGGITRLIARKRGIGKDIIGGIVGGAVGAVVGVIVGAVAGGIARRIAGGDGSSLGSILIHLATLATFVGFLAGSIAGSIAMPIAEKKGIALTFVAGRIGGIVGGIVGGIGSLAGTLLFPVAIVSVWEWGVIVAGTIGVGIVEGIAGAIVLGIVETNDRGRGIATGLMLLIAGGLFFGIISISTTNVLGIALVITMGVILGIVRPSTLSILLGIALGIARIENLQFLTAEGIKESLALVLCFIAGYYRLPLYPISCLSTFRTYLASRKNPPEVFSYLQRCSLYWDERVFLPLPGLKRTLLIAAEQNVEQTLEHIAFTVAERPHQLAAARAASLEIAVHDLELREGLHEIAQASQRLNEILPQEAGLIDPRWVTPFARLHDTSRDAARACSPLGWQARRAALQEMSVHLKKVYPNTAFTDAQLNARLAEVVKMWRAAAHQELELLEYAPEKTSRIDNPYNPGPALELGDSLFVGRCDLAQQLGETLSRRSRRPTFLLHGERRMGKSSTLKQLPDLLGAHYLPIFYDLQTRGFSSSSAIFLGKIAEEIYKVMTARGLAAQRLPYEQLQEAGRRNETEVYYYFERWLEKLELTLEQEDRTLLLTFDEFEKLEDAEQRGYLDLDLLLDWFRSIIQNHPRLALLFSGVRGFGEMGAKWAGYFVNVQTLKVSFLQPEEARQLITRPVPNFPSEQVFAEGVVEEIMRMTGCHPFVVQALCSALLDILNADKGERVELADVGIGVQQVVKNWGNTYFRDLWERTAEDQRACLVALKNLGEGDLLTIEQTLGATLPIAPEGRTLRHALETLLERDLVVYEQNRYRIAVPLFAAWVERSIYS